ncbi:related to FMP30 - mitochondrial inner membrane protein with a role in maintaining mitochondrial morphology [Melanopsichium pennsylvanicum]|uniref:Related to FMP30 - mitochondrial inner membrane protein with a role in maintaining mitochondrial morphology n=2 Tax=Melanopsichium pennsylvanicum TaxID=63383 RepID=A0AAJ4XKJ6_9BASI|nr:metallo-hydrolase oxidoreductase [Melanopsichium pennsylvanicum 4]SNX83661.1 related to FMP30 - mitochondrial inner membrane protein with a role in maintaining mitochondrial morphology [Melanopsichium pennsylvanicum]
MGEAELHHLQQQFSSHEPRHERHHRSLGQTLKGQDKINSADSVSSSRSSSSSDDVSPAENTGDDRLHGDTSQDQTGSSPPIAYDIHLNCRSSDPVADSQTFPPEQLPSHWVPTLTSQVTRATSSAFGQLTSPSNGTYSRNTTQQIRPEDQMEKDNKIEESHLLQRLTFRNPWEGQSFRKPGVKALFQGGLKWGLPDSYTEGSGKGNKRASGFKSNKKIQRDLENAKAEDQELDEGWDKVEVVSPEWGWPAANLDREVDYMRDEDNVAHSSSSQQQSDRQGAIGGVADYPVKEKLIQEWHNQKDSSRVAARVTWLGHASTLLQLPPLTCSSKRTGTSNRSGSGSKKDDVSTRSINILFDPIFSERCSPSQSAGPQRFTRAPCSIDDLPPIDFVVISHSHYDHLDYHTFKQLHHIRGQNVHAFVPLGVKEKIAGSGGFGWSKDQVSELDWWDSASITLPFSSTFCDGAEVKIHCTPAQHASGRGAGDKDASLWASWVVEWKQSCSSQQHQQQERSNFGFTAFFAGDTGLKYHHDDPHKRAKYPACPAFAEIAQRFHPFDLLLLPISVGSSLSYFRSWDPFPRAISPFPRVSSKLTSSIHMDPHDAVECHEIFKEQKQKAKEKRALVSLAVHYGTFVRNEEQTSADVRELRKACKMKGLRFQRVRDETCLLKSGKEGEQENLEEMEKKEQASQDVFLVADQGKTVWLPIYSI